MRRIANVVYKLSSISEHETIKGLYSIDWEYDLGSMFSYNGEVFMCVDSANSKSTLCSMSRDHSLEALYKMENTKLEALITALGDKIPESVEEVTEDVGD